MNIQLSAFKVPERDTLSGLAAAGLAKFYSQYSHASDSVGERKEKENQNCSFSTILFPSS